MRTDAELASTLSRIDGRGYKAYQDLEGAFSLRDLTLFVDHVQGDPFAAPSKIRLRVPMAVAGLPPALFSTRPRRIALEDFLARQVRSRIGRGRRAPNVSGSGKSGLVEIDAGAQEVIERTALVITADWVEARLRVGLPAAGRRVLGRQADQLLCRALPELARGALCWDQLDRERAQRFVECVENQEHIRSRLDELGLVAFVANGSILPRESGASDRPLRAPGVAVAFQSPASLEVPIEVPNAIDESGTREIRGMGIPRGVTLVVGGGYHGKSTLLRAVERGVYPHIPGDGREYVVSSPGLAKIRAEDGRSVAGVDIASFIRELPGGRDTQHFQTDDASGSTSQAAALVEAVEAGATGLLLDEDTSATNFMVRDARMQALVRREDEPITPFLERVRPLYEELGVSTLLVMGGCGDYFDVADRVLSMREYLPFDVTEQARAIAAASASGRRMEAQDELRRASARVPLASSFDASRGRREIAIDARGRDRIRYGTHDIDLRGLEQLVDASQTRAVGLALLLAGRRFADGQATVSEILDALDELLDTEGLDALDPFPRPGHHPGELARPRRLEIAGALNRLRSLHVRDPERET